MRLLTAPRSPGKTWRRTHPSGIRDPRSITEKDSEMAAIKSPALGTENVRGAGRAMVVAGGACWAAGVVQYAAAQVVAAGAWTRPYSLKNNYISDLGNTACGMFHVPHGTPYYVCSTSHAVLNLTNDVSGGLLDGAML